MADLQVVDQGVAPLEVVLVHHHLEALAQAVLVLGVLHDQGVLAPVVPPAQAVAEVGTEIANEELKLQKERRGVQLQNLLKFTLVG